MNKLNENVLTETRFKLDIPKLPHTVFNVQRATLPALTLGSSTMPAIGISDYPVIGNKVEFDTFNVELIVDENLNNYKEIKDWMFSATDTNQKNYIDLYSDMSLSILKHDNTYKKKFQFANAFPSFMSELAFDSTSADASALFVNITFKFAYFDLLV